MRISAMRMRFISFLMFIILSGTGWTQAPPADSPTTRSADAATSASAGLQIPPVAVLLADPATRHPEFQWLRERRAWLARRDGKIEDFQKVAEELAARKAHFAAMELLWFAEKMSRSPEVSQALNDRMRALQAAAGQQDRDVEAAIQLWDAGNRQQAMGELQKIVKANIYAEKAHYQLGCLLYRDYEDAEGKKDGLPPPAARARIFRICYNAFMSTLAIDPLYADAYDRLNLIRSLLPDEAEFLNKTNYLTQRALDFRTCVVPAVEKLEGGDRTPEALLDAAEAFETTALFEYAVYALQAARAQAEGKPEQIAQIDERLAKLRAERFKKP